MGHGSRKKGKSSKPSKTDDLSQYAQAYENARFYHKTYSDSVDGIRKGGLDPRYGGTGFTQMSGFNNDVSLNQNTVHLSNLPKTNETYNGVQLRAFLPPDRTGVHQPRGRQGATAWQGIPTEQLALDPEHGLGAWVTRELVPSETMQFPEEEMPNDVCLGIIGQHMGVDDLEQLRALHLRAREQNRLSTGQLTPQSIEEYKDKFYEKRSK